MKVKKTCEESNVLKGVILSLLGKTKQRYKCFTFLGTLLNLN